MKNIKFERNRLLQKQYARKPIKMENGIIVRHVYPTISPLSWWDDTGFNLNRRHISIWWRHPRLAFNDLIEDMAHTNIPSPRDNSNLFDGSTKIYKYVGKSGKRKKVSAYKCADTDRTVFLEWYDKLTVEQERLRGDNDICITPSMKVEWLDWCRGVSITVPMEIKGYDDLKTLCILVKKLLKGETTLEKEFPNYTYTKEDWLNENKQDDSMVALKDHFVK